MTEQNFSPEKNEKHGQDEFRNLWVCQKIIRDWTDHPEWESYEVLPVLYKALHLGERNTVGNHSSPKLAGVVRTTEARLSGSPENLLPDSRYVYLLTSKYSTKLDERLRQKPKTMRKAIEDAAFAYYVFDRIHPFPDGNGRIGRMIVKRVFKSANLKDPVFHNQAWYGGGRSPHLEALEKVDETNNLSHLEIFLAESLIDVYDPIRDFFKHREVEKIVSDKTQETKTNRNSSLSDIWDGFKNIPIFGN